MAELDQPVFVQVTKKCPNILACKLDNLLHRINRKYTAAKRGGGLVNFEEIRDAEIERCGLRNLFDFEPYKSAVGIYYNLRRQPYEPLKVYEADANEVLIAVTEEVYVRFKARPVMGELAFNDVFVSDRGAKSGASQWPPSPSFKKAKERALAIMNSHRGFR